MNTLLQTFLRAITLQLSLLLIALPIFIYWGLPLSIASCIGTLFFGPFLTIFLLIASLLFFTQLLSIPNTLLCIPLEYVTNIWKFFLSFSSQTWLIGFVRPPIILLITISIITIYIITHPKLQTTRKQLTTLSLFFFFITVCLKIYPYFRKPYSTEIECGKKNLHIITHPKTTIIYDPSALATKTSPDGWLQFTLASELLKHTGKLKIDHFIARTVSNRLLQTLTLAINTCTIKHIYLPMHPKLTTEQNPHFCTLRDILKENGATLVCVENSATIMVDLSIHINLNKKGRKSPYLYTDITINGKEHQIM